MALDIRRIISQARGAAAKRRLKGRCELLIHPTAKVNYVGVAARPPATLAIGAGSIFEGRIDSERTGTRVSIGANSFVGYSSLICADGIEIGDDVLISWGCTIVDHHSHTTDWERRRNDVRDWYAGRKNWSDIKIAPIRIGDKAWIGFNSIVLAGVRIGEGAVVGCGSIVTRDVRPYAVVAGNPARPIRQMDRPAEELDPASVGTL